jgi:hypothetical protein
MTKKPTQRVTHKHDDIILNCPHCTRTCSSKTGLANHIRAKHSVINENTESIPEKLSDTVTITNVQVRYYLLTCWLCLSTVNYNFRVDAVSHEKVWLRSKNMVILVFLLNYLIIKVLY